MATAQIWIDGNYNQITWYKEHDFFRTQV